MQKWVWTQRVESPVPRTVHGALAARPARSTRLGSGGDGTRATRGRDALSVSEYLKLQQQRAPPRRWPSPS